MAIPRKTKRRTTPHLVMAEFIVESASQHGVARRLNRSGLVDQIGFVATGDHLVSFTVRKLARIPKRLRRSE